MNQNKKELAESNCGVEELDWQWLGKNEQIFARIAKSKKEWNRMGPKEKNIYKKWFKSKK